MSSFLSREPSHKGYLDLLMGAVTEFFLSRQECAAASGVAAAPPSRALLHTIECIQIGELVTEAPRGRMLRAFDPIRAQRRGLGSPLPMRRQTRRMWETGEGRWIASYEVQGRKQSEEPLPGILGVRWT